MSFKYYWEDFTPGRVFEYGARTLGEAEIIAFASDWDPQRFHTDPAQAKATPYGGVIASGWHTGCVLMRFMCDAYLNEASCIGSPGIEDWRFALPVRPGDTLRYRAKVLEARPSASKPDRGIVKWQWELLNQRDEVPVSMVGTQFFLRRPRRDVMRHVLRIREFGLFLAGRFVSVLAAQMQWVAVGWYLYDLTGSALTLAFAGLASFVPIALLTLPAGDLADRIDRRWLLGTAHFIQASAAALLLVLVAIHVDVVWPFYAALVLSGCTRALSGPAAKSLAPLLVPREQFAQSVAWATSAQQIAIITGPALGGLIYLLGAPFTFAACTVLALLSAVAMIALRTRVIASKEDGTDALQRAIAGFRYLLTQPVVLGAITLDLFAVLLGGVHALLPIFARDILQVGPAGLGILRSTFAVGAIASSLALAQLPEQRQPHAGKALFGGVAVFGVGAIVFALSRELWLSMIALALMGAGDALSVFVRATIVQLATPQEMRGRVSAIHVLFVGCTNELGEFRAGLLASLLGAAPAAVAGGVGTLVVVGLWAKFFPQLRRVNRLSEVSAV